jgi:putative transposase
MREKENKHLELKILAVHRHTRGLYGNELLQKELATHGLIVSLYKVRKLREKLNLRCKQVKKFKATTNSRHKYPVAKNVIGQNFKVQAPNKMWVSDITYISTREGWLYLASHKDLFNGEIVGYALFT